MPLTTQQHGTVQKDLLTVSTLLAYDTGRQCWQTVCLAMGDEEVLDCFVVFTNSWSDASRPESKSYSKPAAQQDKRLHGTVGWETGHTA